MKKEINPEMGYNHFEEIPEEKPEEKLEKDLPDERLARLCFGAHPDYIKHSIKHSQELREKLNPSVQEIEKAILGEKAPVSEFYNKLHQEVFLIPRDRYLNVVNEDGNSIELETKKLPFSSYDFYIDFEKEGIFQELYYSKAFFRLAKIKQLGYLISPLSKEETEKLFPFYLHSYPWFRHTRQDHSILTAALMKVVLARNGFSEEESIAPVLTAAYHDIAMPAGGDFTKRIDPKNLEEEKNFTWVMERNGLAEKWNKKFGFDISLANEWVQDKHLIGKLLDVLDKISYTALDCWHIGQLSRHEESKIVSLCVQHPLIMDVWQDIKFTPDKTNFGFSNPDRLFQFLLLRAYAHKELFLNPDSLTVEYFFKQKVQLLYEKGLITKEQLLANDDEWLLLILNKYYPEEVKGDVDTGSFYWKRFSTPEEQKEFANQKGDRVIDLVYESGFNPGLNLPIISQDRKTITPIEEVIGKKEIDELKEISKSTGGYYVYFAQKIV
ncbi:MAG: hypothetical protein KYQ20_02575 [Candidatus Nealsonbacteria bacterium]|nr:hypothetical protein [Candidatus Nealsonbacteria bacterium]